MGTREPSDGHKVAGVFDGLEAVAQGIGFVVGTPSVWGYALVPAVMLPLLACGLGGLGIWGAVRANAALVGESPEGWVRVGGWLLTATLASSALLAAVLLALALAQPLSGFALEAISRAQERSLTGRAPPGLGFVASFLLTARVTLIALAIGWPILAVLFFINLAFPPAALVTVPLKLLVCGWLLAWDFLDYPLGLRGMRLLDRVRWVLRRFGAFTAFGVAWALFVFMPGVVLVLLPMGVAGATRLVVREEE